MLCVKKKINGCIMGEAHASGDVCGSYIAIGKTATGWQGICEEVENDGE